MSALPRFLPDPAVIAHRNAAALAISAEQVELASARLHRISTSIRELRLELEEAERAHADALDTWGRVRDRIPQDVTP